MDPNQTWRDLADAVQEDDWERAGELATALLEWLDKDGYPPTISRHQAFDRIVAQTACKSIIAWEVE